MAPFEFVGPTEVGERETYTRLEGGDMMPPSHR